MRKGLIITGIIVLLTLTGCILEDSLEKILDDFQTATENLLADVTKADEKKDSEAVAAALKKYGKRVNRLVTRVQKLVEKNKDESIFEDDDFKKMMKAFQQVADEFGALVVKLAKYITDSEVMAALGEAKDEIADMLSQKR